MAGTRVIRDRRRLGGWLAAWIVLIAAQVLASVVPGDRAVWVSPIGLFVVVVFAATACAIAAAVVVALGWRDGTAELAMIGSFTMAVSLLPLVHGITTPGVWYGPNDATMSSVFWALPIASVVVVPLASPRSAWSRAVSRHWRPLVVGHLLAVLVVSVGLLVEPSLLPVWPMGSGTALGVSLLSLSVCVLLSFRQLRLAAIAGTRQQLWVSAGFMLVGASSLVWVAGVPFGAGFWLAHFLDIVGVLLVAIGAAYALRQRMAIRDVLRPLTVHTPLAALELGLDPLVHRFVASLEHKDPVTRDHVVRSAELAMAVGERLGADGSELQRVGLGALLHDIGKLDVLDEILTKNDRLTSAEYEVMKHHSIAGEALVSQSMVLAPIAPIVRGHHERMDGRGYPDGCAGEQIPLLARIVAVCDAFDAMSHTRRYRDGMGADGAIAVLREHAGTQWDPHAVEALIGVVQAGLVETGRLAEAGRAEPISISRAARCGCDDALPETTVARMLG